ncbi:hypothetical protein XELAEV_18001753mg [Xenopus laevis]|uniref:Uncharacterized protein n=1 Tax=Xenopus laevis TaxID=8355 RepID=A0A974BQG0_XENLA|nr:hypothetical protein XELAEV_18001753mg [Xenopus laevis]
MQKSEKGERDTDAKNRGRERDRLKYWGRERETQMEKLGEEERDRRRWKKSEKGEKDTDAKIGGGRERQRLKYWGRERETQMQKSGEGDRDTDAKIGEEERNTEGDRKNQRKETQTQMQKSEKGERDTDAKIAGGRERHRFKNWVY